MKKHKLSKLVLLVVLTWLASMQNTIAKHNPPMPRGSGGFDGSDVVGGDIDNYIVGMYVIAIIFGMYMVIRAIPLIDNITKE